MRTDYPWEASYRAAILETDDVRLGSFITVAKGAIDHRLEELQKDHGGSTEERRAIADALAALNALRRERERVHGKVA
jgi:hypothetical protein